MRKEGKEENDLSHMNYEQRESFKNEYVYMYSRYNIHWKYSITLTFKYPVSDEKFELSRIVNDFISILSSRVFGKRSNKRIRMIPFKETHQSGHHHLHITMEDVESRMSDKRKENFVLKEEISKAWMNTSSKTTAPGRSLNLLFGDWFQDIYYEDGWLNYCLKETLKVNKKKDPTMTESHCLKGRKNEG